MNAPAGGYGYTGMQSSSQSQFSYNLSQGSRARTQSTDVNEALYNLDRVLHGESATDTVCVCRGDMETPHVRAEFLNVSKVNLF